MITKNHKPSQKPITLVNNNHIIQNPNDVAKTLNKYFINVAPNLLKKLPNPKPNQSFHSYLSKSTPNSFFFRETNEQEVRLIIKSLDSKKAVDIYGFPISVIKDLTNVISLPLAHIVNSSLANGIFPDMLKLAKVIPLFKGGDQCSPNNYRPISILPIFDKVIEKLMHSRLISFLNKHNTLNSSQYGFQKKRSTTQAILDMLSHVSNATTDKSPSCCIFLDLAKAFDTVNHNILLHKLNHYGIRGKINDWFRSYLSNRTQSVSVLQYSSPPLEISCGVPQGSILGPLLFIIYINDIQNASKNFKLIQFADDTCLFLSEKNAELLKISANNELVKISDWLVSNALSINLKKSNFLYFRNNNHPQELGLQLMGTPIDQKQVIKYLGVQIDDKLNWNYHINLVKQKVSQGIGILKKVKFLIPPNFMSNIYSSFIQSHLYYANLAWASPNTSTNSLDKLISQSHKIMASLEPVI